MHLDWSHNCENGELDPDRSIAAARQTETQHTAPAARAPPAAWRLAVRSFSRRRGHPSVCAAGKCSLVASALDSAVQPAQVGREGPRDAGVRAARGGPDDRGGGMRGGDHGGKFRELGAGALRGSGGRAACVWLEAAGGGENVGGLQPPGGQHGGAAGPVAGRRGAHTTQPVSLCVLGARCLAPVPRPPPRRPARRRAPPRMLELSALPCDRLPACCCRSS